jgi:hypothetical protein
MAVSSNAGEEARPEPGHHDQASWMMPSELRWFATRPYFAVRPK